MERAELITSLSKDLQHLPENHRVLDAALNEALNKLKLGSSLQDMLRSKLTVRQVLITLANLKRSSLVSHDGSIFAAIDGMAQAIQSPAATGHHLISTAFVDENPLYRKAATALLEEKNLDYDQSIETYESQMRRFKMMQALGDCHHGRLFVLGDDALFSLYLALHGVQSEIWVGDIDPDLRDFVKTTANALNLTNINVFSYNVFDDLPQEHVGEFDCVTINGFKDLGGLLMFICRGVQSLKAPKQRRTGYFNFGSVDVTDEAMYSIDFEVQKFLTKIGVTLEHLVPAPESHIDDEIAKSMIDIIETGSKANDLEGCIDLVDKGLKDVKARYGRISWVAVENFPNIVLAPLKIGQFRIHDLQEAEIKRFLRLTRMFQS